MKYTQIAAYNPYNEASAKDTVTRCFKPLMIKYVVNAHVMIATYTGTNFLAYLTLFVLCNTKLFIL